MNGLKLCEICKGLWVYFGAEKYPKYCPSCDDVIRKKDKKELGDITQNKTQNINSIVF